MHAPVCSQYTLDTLPGREFCFLDLDDEVEDRETLPIRPLLFAQRRSHHLPVREALTRDFGQRNNGVHFAPVPDSSLVRIAEPEPCHTCIHIKSQTICLAFFA